MAMVYDRTLDVKGLKCPVPLVQSRKMVKDMPVGSVLQVVATDKGSLADFQGWAGIAKDIELLSQETVQNGGNTLYLHYVKRTR